MAMMDLISVCLLVPFIFTSWSPVLGTLLVKPNDVVVGLGETVQLNCSTDDKYSVNWWHVPVGSTTNEDVFISRVVVLPYHPRFKVQRNDVENSTHDYNLVISSVNRQDAGKYTCIDRAGHGEQWDAQLVVLEPRPECQTNIDREGFVGDNDCEKRPEEFRCSCSQQYFGNNPPAMEWTNAAGEVIEPQPPVDTSQRNIISSNLAVKPRLVMNGTSIVWRAQLLKHNNWTSANIKLKYVSRNATEVNVTRGESIVCSANSSETCTYQWTMQNGTMVSEAANLTIVDAGTYFCDATCSLRQDKCTVRSMVAEFKNIPEGNTKETTNGLVWTAAVVIGLFLVSLSVVLFVVLGYIRVKRRKKKKYIPYVTGEELHLMNQLNTKDLMVVGVTILDKLVYVAHHGLNVISVYRTAPKVEHMNEIKVDGLSEPCDMAACPLNRCLYITDSKNKCVWKVQASDGKATKWMDKILEPFTISVSSKGNVLMVRQPDTVAEYNVEGAVVEKCRVNHVPRIEDIQHAVENEQGNFVVIHGGIHDKVHAICEVSKDGGLLRSFGSDPGNGAQQLWNPRHVAVDDQDRVYVVDAFNDRVLQLDKKLQTVLKIPCSARSQPLRLAVNDGQTLIGKYGAVDVFSTCDTRRLEQNGEYSAVPTNDSPI